LEGTRPTRR